MWIKKNLNINGYEAIVFYFRSINEDSACNKYGIKKLVFLDQDLECKNAYQYLTIVFQDYQAAYKFYVLQPEVVLNLTNGYPGNDHRIVCNVINGPDLEFSFIECNLFKNKLSDLLKLKLNFEKNLLDLPLEFFDMITAKPRELIDMEINFYEKLSNLNQDNFVELFNQANQIIKNYITQYDRSFYLYCSKTLWELATECKQKTLILEWFITLNYISIGSDNYPKAQEELGLFILAQINNPIFSEYSKALLTCGLKYAFNSVDCIGIEIAKKITLNFLELKPEDQEGIFTNMVRDGRQDNFSSHILAEEDSINYITDLIIYTKKLKTENYNLKQQLDKLSSDNSSCSPALLLKCNI